MAAEGILAADKFLLTIKQIIMILAFLHTLIDNEMFYLVFN